MPMSVTYATMNGRVIYENRGGVEKTYARDPLGNTVALLDMAGNITDTYTYWPYGEVQSHTGISTTPFTFVGTLGYFKDFIDAFYVRARHFKSGLTRWMTVDPLWPDQNAYVYVDCSPASGVDPSGLLPGFDVAAAGLGCATSGIVGFVGGCFKPNAPCQSICRGIGGCVIGAAVGFLTGNFPWLAKCLIGFAAGGLSAAVGLACDHICHTTGNPPPILCTLASILFGGVVGCVTSGLNGIIKPAPKPVTVTTSIINNMLAKICSYHL